MNGIEVMGLLLFLGALVSAFILLGLHESEEWADLHRQERARAAMGRAAERSAR